MDVDKVESSLCVFIIPLVCFTELPGKSLITRQGYMMSLPWKNAAASCLIFCSRVEGTPKMAVLHLLADFKFSALSTTHFTANPGVVETECIPVAS